MFITTLFLTVSSSKIAQVSINRKMGMLYINYISIKLTKKGKWINKLQYSHTMEYYSVVKSKLQVHATTWTNLKNIGSNSKIQIQRLHTAWFHLYKSKNKKNLQNRIMMGRTILNHSCLYEGGKGHEGLSAVMIDSMS